MPYQLGVISYERPEKPVSIEEIKPILLLAGKDVIKLAWGSLAPDSDNRIYPGALHTWLGAFFNIRSGSEVTNFLYELNLIKCNATSSWPRSHCLPGF